MKRLIVPVILPCDLSVPPPRIPSCPLSTLDLGSISPHPFLPQLITMVTQGAVSVVLSSIACFWDNFPSEFHLFLVISALILLPWRKTDREGDGGRKNPSMSDIFFFFFISVTRRLSLADVTYSFCFPSLVGKATAHPMLHLGVKPKSTFNTWLTTCLWISWL